jgi:hypothetical protein
LNPAPAVVFAALIVALASGLVLTVLGMLAARAVAPHLDALWARFERPTPAVVRARELFLAQLDDRQRRSWFLRRSFEVRAASGRRYTIFPHQPFNVRARGAAFCLDVIDEIPDYDKLLAQKLLIETDEAHFLACANIRTLSRAWLRVAAEHKRAA